jgi:hypothetical protein
MNTTYLIAILCAPLWIALWKAIGFSLAFFIYDTHNISALIRWNMGIDRTGQPCPIYQHEQLICNLERAILWRS